MLLSCLRRNKKFSYLAGISSIRQYNSKLQLPVVNNYLEEKIPTYRGTDTSIGNKLFFKDVETIDPCFELVVINDKNNNKNNNSSNLQTLFIGSGLIIFIIINYKLVSLYWI